MKTKRRRIIGWNWMFGFGLVSEGDPVMKVFRSAWYHRKGPIYGRNPQK